MAQKVVGIIPHKTNDLVLNEQATVIFTVGGVDITTNLQPKSQFSGRTASFSKAFTLDDLPPEESLFKDLKQNKELALSFDKRNAKYFAKYGSLLELVRVSLDGIILDFPASIHSKEQVLNLKGNNVQGAGYFVFDDTMTFAANVSFFSNPFNIYFLDNLQFQYSDQRINPIRNLTLNWNKYELVVNGQAYPILDFTPSTKSSADFVRIKVKGQPFEIGNSSQEFYIKPIESEIDKFYKNLEDFEAYLLNRETNYSAVFYDTKESDNGVLLNYKLRLRFPKLDQYNIDTITNKYTVYLNDLVSFATKFDETHGNLLMRRLTPENIQSITLEDPTSAFSTYGKINRVLIVYGRLLDDINKHIENLKFFNNVTYDKRDNIPEALIPSYARNLGWDVDVPESINKDTWRYLILNSWWVWKSKGTRKAIEFILDFLAIPREIVDFNEFIIRAKRPIDVSQLEFYYSLFDGQFDISQLPIDENGYPLFPNETSEDYFQIFGIIDNGIQYFQKYLNLLPSDFTGSSVSYVDESTSVSTVFEQDFNGTGNTLTYRVVDDNFIDNLCYDSSGNTIGDPYPEIILDVCGCPLPISDKTLEICAQPVSLSGCTPIILDIFYECADQTNADLTMNIYGGTPPYTVSGLTVTPQQSGSVFTDDTVTGVTYNVQVFDANSCPSDIYSFEINCQDPCLGTTITVDLDYICETDEFGLNTGNATVTLNYSGGTAPYTVIGVNSGDTVSDGEIITVEVIDSRGCSSGQVGLTVDCPPPDAVACDPITLEATLETTNSEQNNNTAKVNVTYDLLGLPTGLFVNTVEMTCVGVGGDDAYVVGSPVVETFSTPSGADTISLDFNPDPLQGSITIDVTIDITLNNGCNYSDNYQMTVDPRQLGNVDTYNAILS